MRVRPQLRRTPAADRRPHVIGRAAADPADPAEPAPPAEAAEAAAPVDADPDLRAENRMREAGGPDDRAFYRCSCGYAFEADVCTSVACPHCGAGQAW
jgi:hypothetical protein